jgi:AraC-like DNA-binding protein
LKKLKDGTHRDLTQKQLNDLWLNASHLANDKLFGLHFGESLQLAALGIVGEIIKSSHTVGEALTQASALIHLFTDQFELEIRRKRETFIVYVRPAKADQSFTFLQMRDLIMVFLIHEMDGLLLEKIKPDTVKLAVDRENISEYERVLRCKPTAKGLECSIELKLAYWNEPILTANYELQNMLLQKVHSLKERQRPALKDKIERYLIANSYLGIQTLENVAANYNMGPRSLQRRLQDEGITFQQLADQVRKSLAEHYLASGEYQIKEISNILGYNELSAFSRAFKRWTGKSPGAF